MVVVRKRKMVRFLSDETIKYTQLFNAGEFLSCIALVGVVELLTVYHLQFFEFVFSKG